MRVVFVMLLVACAAGLAVAKKKGGVVETRPGGVEIDWNAGVIRATGAGAADIRAPNAEIARVGATRQARKDATARLVEAAIDLAKADGAAKKRIAAAAERVRDVGATYSTDGSVRLTAALPLEAVRLAVTPSTDVPKAGGPTAVLVEATGLKVEPRLGVTLVADKERWAGPTVWAESLATAEKDPRIGDKPVRAKAKKTSKDEIEVDLPPADLAAARNSGALVIVIL